MVLYALVDGIAEEAKLEWYRRRSKTADLELDEHKTERKQLSCFSVVFEFKGFFGIFSDPLVQP